MAKYIVYLERTITENASVEVEADSEEDAKDLAHDRICEDDIDFEAYSFDADINIISIDIVEVAAD